MSTCSGAFRARRPRQFPGEEAWATPLEPHPAPPTAAEEHAGPTKAPQPATECAPAYAPG
eukprot:14302154-Alexandrium_andersonii.AAC.1